MLDVIPLYRHCLNQSQGARIRENHSNAMIRLKVSYLSYFLPVGGIYEYIRINPPVIHKSPKDCQMNNGFAVLVQEKDNLFNLLKRKDALGF